MDQPPPSDRPDDDESWRYGPPPDGPQADKVSGAAPWWKRAVAYIIDSLIVAAPLGAFASATGLVEIVKSNDTVRVNIDPIFQILSVALTVIYSAVMDGGRRQASVGKMAVRIQVGDADTGMPIGTARAGSRRLISSGLFALYLIPGVVNALSPLWDKRHQAFHDKAVRSIVTNAPS